jgi:hypothetical protein
MSASPMTSERDSADQCVIAGHMTRPGTAFVLRKRFGSRCVWFLIEGLAGRGVPGVIVANGRRLKK